MLPLLQGIRVLDFTTIVLGPYATQTLGDLGADVIKIEPLQGDLFRTVRPGRSRAMGAGFMGFNRNKRSLAIDLKRPEARDVLARLVVGADVVVHNMRPRAAEPLGLAYDQLVRLKPDLVYAFAAGYDQSGPSANEPAYDDIIQAAAGVAALNANASGEPRYLATILCDKVGGLHLAMAVATGLAHRARTGQGCCIEAPMFESTVAFLMSEQLGGETFVPALGPDRLRPPGRAQPQAVPHAGRLHGDPAVQRHALDGVLRDHRTRGICTFAAGAGPGAAQPERGLRCTRSLPRSRPRGRRRSGSNHCARRHPVRARELDRRTAADPHLLATGFFHEYDHPTEGRLRAPRTPFRWHGGTESADRHAPRPGADSRTVLAEAGFASEEIDRLAADGVIGTGSEQ